MATATVELRVIALGGIITSLRTPDHEERWANIVLGYDSLDAYAVDEHYLGALIGRYANRIAAGRFELNGACYQLATNDGPNHLHGGPSGFHRFYWDLEVLHRSDAVGIRLSRISPHDEEHYPGTLRASVVYWLTSDNTIRIEYEAAADRPTHVNMTQHTYFNLTGTRGQTVLNSLLHIHADHYLPVDGTLIPTGRIESVAGTPFDFRQTQPIGERLSTPHDQLRRAAGFDHTFVLNGPRNEPSPAATLYEPTSRRRLDVSTTEPGLQFYSGQWLDRRPAAGRSHRAFARHEGLCLETQHFPDSPNHGDFPSTRLDPGDIYRSVTCWTPSTD